VYCDLPRDFGIYTRKGLTIWLQMTLVKSWTGWKGLENGSPRLLRDPTDGGHCDVLQAVKAFESAPSPVTCTPSRIPIGVGEYSIITQCVGNRIRISRTKLQIGCACKFLSLDGIRRRQKYISVTRCDAIRL